MCSRLFRKLLRLVPGSNPNPLLSQATPPIYMTFYNAKLQEENGQKSIGIYCQETAPEHLFVISQGVVSAIYTAEKFWHGSDEKSTRTKKIGATQIDFLM